MNVVWQAWARDCLLCSPAMALTVCCSVSLCACSLCSMGVWGQSEITVKYYEAMNPDSKRLIR